MNKLTFGLAAAALAIAPALTGCQRTSDVPPGTDAVVIDDSTGFIDDTTFNMGAEADTAASATGAALDNAGNAIQGAAQSAGETIRDGAAATGAAVQRAAESTGDAVTNATQDTIVVRENNP